MSTFHDIPIKNIIKETADAVSVVFDIPNTKKTKFSFKAGQYLTLKTMINGEEVRRAYSICSSPDSGEVQVAIKAVENGKFSVYATEKLTVGDIIEVHEPEGKFILEPQADKNYIAFAAGSGITPIMSMIKTTLQNTSRASFTLIYGNKSEADTIFKSELDNLQKIFSDRFNLHYVFSRQNIANALFGRIDQGVTNFFVAKTYKNISFDAAFLCGPEAMINTVSETLQNNGFGEDQIKFELFTTSSEEADTSEVPNGETAVTIMLDDEELFFTMKQTDDILSSSLRNKVDAPYSCQGGICSSCIAKVTEGKAVMVKNSILTNDEVEEGFILTCQAHPTTPKIYVDFDEV